MARSDPVVLLLALVLAPVVEGQIQLTDATEGSGLSFVHWDGGSGRHHFVEQVGGGVGLLDLDQDGVLDVFLACGAPLPGSVARADSRSRVFRGRPGLRFEDVTAAQLSADPGYATGCAAGDVDADGDIDLYVTCFGPNRLYVNEGTRLVDRGAAAHVDDPGLGASAAFLDHDLDGDLDLYVTNYVETRPGKDRPCTRNGLPVYCLPQDCPGQADHLFRNEGDGTFTDITRAAGIERPRSRGLGVVAADLDDNGAPDLVVANDTNENELFQNDGKGNLRERGLEAGVALGENGGLQNGMGVDAGDFDGDGRIDLVITNFEGQTNTLLRNVGGGFFADVSFLSGIGRPSLPHVGWAAIFADLDLDGRLDLLVTNGHVFENTAQLRTGTSHEQPVLLHRNEGGGRFSTQVLDAAAGWRVRVGRGAAVGDLDNDGDLDAVLNCLNAPAKLLRNDTLPPGAWAGLDLSLAKGVRTAAGARVTWTVNGATQLRELKCGSGYLSQNDLRVVLAFPDGTLPDRVIVRWPSGVSEDVTQRVRPGAYVRLAESKR